MNPICGACGGKCCSFRTMAMTFLTIGERRLDDVLSRPELLSQLRMADGSVPDMDWYVITTKNETRALVFECNHLKEGLCTVYENRPGMCRAYQCDALEGTKTLEEMLAVTTDANPNWKEAWGEPLDLADITDRMHRAIAASPADLPPAAGGPHPSGGHHPFLKEGC